MPTPRRVANLGAVPISVNRTFGKPRRMIDLTAMSAFADLKLDGQLLARLEQLGYHRPTALQREAVPIISRGTTAAGVASAGSGKTLAYALGLASRHDPETPTLQVLVLRPTDATAARTAESLQSVLSARNLEVGITAPDLPLRAQIAVASPASALAAVERSEIKLGGLGTLIVDGASAMFDLNAGEPLETLTASVPKEAQRVLLSARLSHEVEGWIERHARRARRLLYLPTEIEPLSDTTIEYFAGPREQRLALLTRLLSGTPGGRAPASRILCRTRPEAVALADRLRVRGIAADTNGETAHVVIDWREPTAADGDLSVLWEAPPDVDAFLPRVRAAARSVVLLEPAELDHLRRLAQTLEVHLKAMGTAAPEEAQRSLAVTYESLRQALEQRDLEAYQLLLEPLFVEFTPAEVAAAATSLLRERESPAPPERLPAWTRLYFAVGRRDGVRPADLVGAIAGESPASGDQIGRIEIRDTHSLVEIDAPVADQVIKALARTAIRGRPANVRVFRE